MSLIIWRFSVLPSLSSTAWAPLSSTLGYQPAACSSSTCSGVSGGGITARPSAVGGSGEGTAQVKLARADTAADLVGDKLAITRHEPKRGTERNIEPPSDVFRIEQRPR